MRWLAIALVLGCRAASDVPAVVGSGSGSGGGGSTAAIGDESSSSGADVQVPDACAFNSAFRCAAAFDCAEVTCGGPTSPFDASGCLRLTCHDDEDCPDGHHCIAPHHWGGEEWSTAGCDETPEGDCDCDAWWYLWPPSWYCVDAGEIPGGAATPEEYCAAQDVAECNTEPLGICLWIRAVDLLDAATCAMGAPAEACEAVARAENPSDPGNCPTAFYRELPDGRMQLTTTPLEPATAGDPHGWLACSVNQPGCACACDPGLP